MDTSCDRLLLALARVQKGGCVEDGVRTLVDAIQADGPVGVLYDGTPGKRPAVPVRLALEAELVGEGCSAEYRYDEAR
jgi:hypothetical protein